MKQALAYRLSQMLASGEMSEQILREIGDEAHEADPGLAEKYTRPGRPCTSPMKWRVTKGRRCPCATACAT